MQAATSHVPPQPTLYLHGRDDGAIGVEVAEAAAVMTADDEHVTIEVLDDCGHFLHLERPDAVNERVLEFLS
jgi:pimeloyl-ACP methyl ester carboxylesterase